MMHYTMHHVFIEGFSGEKRAETCDIPNKYRYRYIQIITYLKCGMNECLIITCHV